MKLEDKYCTPEQSEKLVKLGVKIKSITFWTMFQEYVLSSDFFIDDEGDLRQARGGNRFLWDWLPAYDIAELMEILPNNVGNHKINHYELIVKKDVNNHWVVGYQDFMINKTLVKIGCKNLAESLADLLTWIIKNKHINPEDLK